MNSNLDQIVKQINSGEFGTAERTLRSLLIDEPQNVDAWMLLATLVPDPAGKSECYQQVLRIEPDHPRAARRLNTLSKQRFQPPAPAGPPAEEAVISCPQCGGAMEVYVPGDMQEPRAVCPFCLTAVDLPDSFQRIPATRTQTRKLEETRPVDETPVETRQDGKVESAQQPPEIQAALRLVRESGTAGLDEAGLEEGAAAGSHGLLESLLQSEHPETETRNQGFFSRLFPRRRKRKQAPDPLSLVRLIQLAGGGIPPEDRQQCPNPRCGATIAKGATKCSWCGESVPDSGN